MYTLAMPVSGVNSFQVNGRVVKPVKIQSPYYIFCNLGIPAGDHFEVCWSHAFYQQTILTLPMTEHPVEAVIKAIPNAAYPYSVKPVGITGEVAGAAQIQVLMAEPKGRLIYQPDAQPPIGQALAQPLSFRSFQLKEADNLQQVTFIDETQCMPDADKAFTGLCEVMEYAEVPISEGNFYFPISRVKRGGNVLVVYEDSSGKRRTQSVTLDETGMTYCCLSPKKLKKAADAPEGT
jgi:hypothetical protein